MINSYIKLVERQVEALTKAALEGITNEEWIIEVNMVKVPISTLSKVKECEEYTTRLRCTPLDEDGEIIFDGIKEFRTGFVCTKGELDREFK